MTHAQRGTFAFLLLVLSLIPLGYYIMGHEKAVYDYNAMLPNLDYVTILWKEQTDASN